MAGAISRLYETVVCILVKQDLLPCLLRTVTSHAHSGQFIKFLKVSFSIHMA
jgi:hypothetical protein